MTPPRYELQVKVHGGWYPGLVTSPHMRTKSEAVAVFHAYKDDYHPWRLVRLVAKTIKVKR